MKTPPRRTIPAVETVLQALGAQPMPRPMIVRAVRAELSSIRLSRSAVTLEEVLVRVRAKLRTLSASKLQPVINGTGVLLHTNLGRAPASALSVEAIRAVASGYCNLELDLETGERGARAAYVETALCFLCQAEACTVVNNCAAALLLILGHFTRGSRKEVIVSRGELVQIGGGFRIPEILEASGARLREVGTTNRTSLADYERAVGPGSALILRVHRSNFAMHGFVESASTKDLAQLARRKRLPFVEDLGSGAVAPTERMGIREHEPTPGESLRNGVDLVCFSGDKLFGGPQAGIIAGREKFVTRLKREPLFRAIRCGKLVLATLQATAESWLKTGGPNAETGTLLLALANEPVQALRERGEALMRALAYGSLEVRLDESQAQVGGGSMPDSSLPSVAIALKSSRFGLADLAKRLRVGQPPVIGYVSGGRLKLDLRTILSKQDEELAMAIRAAVSDSNPPGR